MIFLILSILIPRASLDNVFALFTISLNNFSISPGAILNLVIIVLGALYVVRGRQVRIPRVALIAWAPLIVISGITLTQSPEFVRAARTFIVMLTYAAFTIIGFRLNLLASGNRMVKNILMVSAIVPLSFIPLELLTANNSLPHYRVHSTFPHPSMLSYYCCLLIFYFAHCLNMQRNPFAAKHVVTYGFLLALLVALLLTQMRGAWAALFVSGLVYTFLTRPKLTPIVGLLPLAALLVPPIRDRIWEVFQSPGIDVPYLIDVIQGRVRAAEAIALNSYEWRKIMWEFAFYEIQNRPILGHGFDSFMFYSQTFFPLSDVSYGAHSMYVQYTFEMGLLGLFGYLFLFACLLKTSFHHRRSFPKESSFVISILIMYVVASYSDNMFAYLSFNWYFWFILGSYFAFFSHGQYRRRLHAATMPRAGQQIPARLRKQEPPLPHIAGTIPRPSETP